jgi:glycosyltransferase involved in cell wall biosynthesis
VTTLTAVIPAHGDEVPLRKLLAQARALALFDRVIVVDDGSDPPLPADLAPPGAAPGWLDLLRRPASGGPGLARNQGAARVRSSHLMFLDADDAIVPDLAALWAELRGRPFDFCLFRHADSRVARLGLWGQTAHDQAFWIAAGLDRARLAEVDRAAALQLVQTANFPWNKIYRTGFYAEAGLGCAALPLHVDIRLHWGSFLNAGRILASNRVGVLHHVGDPDRLTARRGRERLALFAALGEVDGWIARDSAWFPAWAGFASGLLGWAAGLIEPADRAEFHRRRRRFLTRLAPAAAFADLVRTRPRTAARILHQLG